MIHFVLWQEVAPPPEFHQKSCVVPSGGGTSARILCCGRRWHVRQNFVLCQEVARPPEFCVVAGGGTYWSGIQDTGGGHLLGGYHTWPPVRVTLYIWRSTMEPTNPAAAHIPAPKYMVIGPCVRGEHCVTLAAATVPPLAKRSARR